MTREEKKLLEMQDMSLLHGWFEEGHVVSDAGTFIPETSGISDDLWTKSIQILEKMDPAQVQAVKSEVKLSRMLGSEKNWWEKIFSVALQAPPEELEKLAPQRVYLQESMGEETFEQAGDLIVQKAARNEVRRRYLKENEERKKLGSLYEKVDQANDALNEAEQNLWIHRIRR